MVVFFPDTVVFNRLRKTHAIEFLIIKTDPNPYCLVVDGTIINCEDNSIKREAIDALLNAADYDDIGGIEKQLSQVKAIVELQLNHPKLFKKFGVKPQRGILLCGPPHTANEADAKLILINGSEINCKLAGDSELILCKAFEEVKKSCRTIIFIDEIDAIAPKREKAHGEAEPPIVSQLLELMNRLKQCSNVIVMAATNRPNSIDPTLRCFDRKVYIGIPDAVSRLQILKVLTKTIKLGSDVNLGQIANETNGYVGTDLAKLCSKVVFEQYREKMKVIDLEEDTIDAEISDSFSVSHNNFQYALNESYPSVLHETVLEFTTTRWEDIGGLESIKCKVKRLAQFQLNQYEEFRKFGMTPSRCVLLYGLPGCGKTLLAKATAYECQVNFMPIRCSKLVAMSLVESEANLCDIFDKVHQAASCVLFFDELDSIACCGDAGDGSGKADRVLHQILTKIDALDAKNNVFIIGSSNKLDVINSAIIQPGRFDKLSHVLLPNHVSRVAILKAVLRKSPEATNGDLNFVAGATDTFNGADLAIEEFVRKKIQFEIKQENGEPDLVASICHQNFIDAICGAKTSINESEIHKYQLFFGTQDIRTLERSLQILCNAGGDQGGYYR
ncbi:unnamed protein product [Adineta steineri]|uniref:AAA+ ATPase domain-containing protein n=1 Tax=Adineta steineri TaxID=433720 RepID=A0A814ENB3_9BILA|nr:unnamed protein product [Adineta steineri]CAF4032813.1 unnamed protein product [Adineta steineri]